MPIVTYPCLTFMIPVCRMCVLGVPKNGIGNGPKFNKSFSTLSIMFDILIGNLRHGSKI